MFVQNFISFSSSSSSSLFFSCFDQLFDESIYIVYACSCIICFIDKENLRMIEYFEGFFILLNKVKIILFTLTFFSLEYIFVECKEKQK